MKDIPLKGDFNEILRVLEERAEGSSWEVVAEKTGHSKKTAIEVEKWFGELPWEKVLAFPERVQRLRKDYLERKAEELGEREGRLQEQFAKALATEKHYSDLSSVAELVSSRIVIPSPRELWVFEPADFTYDSERYGFHCFSKPGAMGTVVSFIDNETGELLEAETFYEPLMCHLPQVRKQSEELKGLLGSYVNACYKLLSSIVSEGKKAVVVMLESKVTDAKQRQEFIDATLSERSLRLVYDDSSGIVIVERDFFTTAYEVAVVRAELRSEHPHEQPEDNSDSPSVDSAAGELRYGLLTLAYGPDSDLQGLLAIHRQLARKHAQSPLSNQVLDSLSKARAARASILTELTTRTLKRTFPGKCDLCPD